MSAKIGKLILWVQNEAEYSSNLYYKDNSQSMLDKSTLRNTKINSFKKYIIFINCNNLIFTLLIK